MPLGPTARTSGFAISIRRVWDWLRSLWLPNVKPVVTAHLPFGPDYQETNSLVVGLANLEDWLQDIRTKSPKLSTLVPNLERELRRASPHFRQQIRSLLELLNSKLPAATADPDRWHDPSLLFEEASEESGLCLFSPDVRAALPPNLETHCCYEGPESEYPAEDLLCKVVALGDLRRFNLELTDSYALLSDEDLMINLEAMPRKGELRGSRPFNWVAKKDELESEVTRSEEAKMREGRGYWTEQDRATRIRDVLGLDNYAGQDYLILITFPEDITLEKQVRSSVWEGVCAPFRPSAPTMPAVPIQNMTVDLSQAPEIVAGLEESCCCRVPFTDEFQLEPLKEKPSPLDTQKLNAMFQNW